jgi:hypothetical protein
MKKCKFLEYKLELLEKENEHKDEIIKLQNTTTKIASKGMSAINYAMAYYNNAPELHQIDTPVQQAILYKETDNDIDTAKMMVIYYKAKSLHKHIGDGIVSIYKKPNPSEQSFHTTDCSRLNYIIMTIVNENKEWKYDSGGIKVVEKVIEPILEKINDLMNEYLKHLSSKPYIDPEEWRNINDVKDAIDDGKLHKQVNLYIAPFFKTSALEAGINEAIEWNEVP